MIKIKLFKNCSMIKICLIELATNVIMIIKATIYSVPNVVRMIIKGFNFMINF